MRKASIIKRLYIAAIIACLQIGSVAVLLGCGQTPPMSEENRKQFSFNVAETNTGYAMSADQLFDFILENRYALMGGTLSRAEVGEILDSLLVDTLAGIAASSVNLSQYRLVYRDYVHQYQDFLIERFTDSAVSSRVSAFDSAEVLAFYQKDPQRFAVNEQVRLYQILISGYGLQTGPDSAYYKKYSHLQLREEDRDRINTVYRLLQ
ncbi:MAG: hypothetical protein HY851_09460, partial [candidate division Zixibacteria bacterium]|nr:hypothetical protein [candidate division Zixibacteria bacterium]